MNARSVTPTAATWFRTRLRRRADVTTAPLRMLREAGLIAHTEMRNGLGVPVRVEVTAPTPDLCAELRRSMKPYGGGRR